MANLRANRITSTEVFETTGSVQFDGSGDYLSLAVSSDFQFGSEDFTIECWAYTPSTDTKDILGIYNTGANRRTFVLRKDQTESVQFLYSSNGTSGTSVDSEDGIINLNEWNHYAVVRKDLEYIIYLNGIRVASRYDANAIYNNTSDGLRIGSSYNTDFEGHISNVRILKGQALYTENFTPPTRELEVIPNTVLLACQSTTKADEEKTGKTITVTGNAVANELTPGLLTSVVKSGGSSAITGSVEFDGSGDYLSVTPTDDFELGSDDFTIEAWVYSRNWKAAFANIIFSKGNSSSTSTEYYSLQATQTAGRMQFFWRSGSALLDGSNTRNLSTDSWNHVAVTRSGDTFSLYINGILDDTATSSTTLTTGVTGGVLIGGQSYDPTNNDRVLTGNISNLRVIKGTALYTSDFTPPTRKLTKLPGTVLLCCQDPDSPLTEATGKTITPYGNLGRTPGEYITFNRTFDSNIDDWEGYNSTPSYDTGRLKIDASTEFDGAQTENTVTVQPNRKYILRVMVELGTAGGVRIQPRVSDNSAALATLDVTADGIYEVPFNSNAETGVHIRLITSGGNTGTAFFDDVSITNATEDKAASNFTPSVGSDGSVEFAVPTTINTENYFYLPTGTTEQRDVINNNYGARGVFAGGFNGPSPTVTNYDTIDYINIASTGNAQDFGDLTSARNYQSAFASSTRGIVTGGNPVADNRLDYITIASTGNAQDFGDALYIGNPGSLANSTRGIFAGGESPVSPNPVVNNINYVTIASTGDSIDFGDLITSTNIPNGAASKTRGIFSGGSTPSTSNTIQFITIATTGNSQDFGDLTITKTASNGGSCSNGIRALHPGGVSGPARVNSIEYITIATTGNGVDYGDLTSARDTSPCSSTIRGIFGGGGFPSQTNAIDYVNIATQSNAIDFGELTAPRSNIGSFSNGHGGLG